MSLKTSTQVVDEQLAAYNARDIHAFCKLYSPQVVVHSLNDDKILMQGIESLRLSYLKVNEARPKPEGMSGGNAPRGSFTSRRFSY